MCVSTPVVPIMDLSDLSPTERAELAAKVGCNPKYLYQCATQWRGKRPSPELARTLVAADPRLTLEELLFPGEPPKKVVVAEPPPSSNPSPRPASGPGAKSAADPAATPSAGRTNAAPLPAGAARTGVEAVVHGVT